MIIDEKIAVAKWRERRILAYTILFWFSTGYVTYVTQWPGWVDGVIVGYFTLNLIGGGFRFGRNMRLLNSPFVYLLVIQEMADKAMREATAVSGEAKPQEARLDPRRDFNPRMN